MASIHQHSVPAEGLQAFPLKPGQKLLVQRLGRKLSTHRPALKCRRVTTFSWRDANDIHGISLTFLDQLVNEVMMQFPLSYCRCLWQDLRLSVDFKSPKVEALCAVPFASSGATWDFHLWITDGETVANISNRSLCLKPQARSVLKRATTNPRGVVWFCAFYGSNCSNNTIGHTGTIFIYLKHRTMQRLGKKEWQCGFQICSVW